MQKHRQERSSEEFQAVADSFSNILGVDYDDPHTAAVSFVSFIELLIQIDKGSESDEDEQKEPLKNH